MINYAVLGLQFGDEGKGKIVDALAHKIDYVVRFQGGNNAGHTLSVKGKQFVAHLLPSGVLHPNTTCVIASGVVVDLDVLLKEIKAFEEQGIAVRDRVLLSDRAHLIMPYHIFIDELQEQDLQSLKIGTTKRGIGPTYADKYSRLGIRVCDLMNLEVFKTKLEINLRIKNKILKHVYNQPEFDYKDMLAHYTALAKEIAPMVVDSYQVLKAAYADKKSILFEGAQASMLDIDFGTYPYVTSSNPSIGGLLVGSGMNRTEIHNVIGVTKAYVTRVGEGTLITEDGGDTGKYLQTQGHEFGATTGRPRRCGHLDLVALKYAVQLNKIDGIVLTKLDVLSGLREVKLCVAYKDGKQTYTSHVPADVTRHAKIKPEYHTLPGWSADISGARQWDDLPPTCQRYVEAIQNFIQVPIKMISVGKDRDQNIFLEEF